MPSSDPPSTAVPAARGVVQAAVETLLIVLVFAMSAAWPVPEPNESHYVSKAKHYWNRQWLADDFFLNTPDWHTTFDLTTGWTTRYLNLPNVARLGRAVTWGLMAFFWRRLSWSIVPRLGASVVSAALAVALNERFQMAGEWFVGGFEAKGIAYALVFGALAEITRGRWNWAWLLLGGATAFHVLVGGWATVAAGVCWLLSGAERPRMASMLPGLLGFAVLAIPVVLESLALSRGVDAATLAKANAIYVFQRTPHHLSFYQMRIDFRWRFAALIAVWGALTWIVPASAGARRVRICVWVSLALAAVGVALSTLARWQPDLAAQWMRFYWFRLADVYVPLGVALTATQLGYDAATHFSRAKTLEALAPLALLALACGLLLSRAETPLAATYPRADKPGKTANYDDWRDVCQWIATNTPEDARFITPRQAQTFRWYAERSEVATQKDMPQDAENLVEWWRRIEALHATGDPEHPWHKTLTAVEPSRLTRVGETYDAQYLLTEAEPELPFPRLFHNQTYAVYQLPRP